MNNTTNKKTNPWTTLSGRFVYDNPWIMLSEHNIVNPAGNPGIYGVVHFKHKAIGIIPLSDDGHIWLVGQWRYPLERYSWEIPEGGGKLDEDPLMAARRELKEETGITADRWDLILEMHLSNSVSDEHALIFLARNLQFGKAQPEETEQLSVRKISLSEAYKEVISGQITDSLSVAGILRLELMHREGLI
jgi:8-oxo-dGTP pyrophosphatase MutT (NUDIX family)